MSTGVVSAELSAAGKAVFILPVWIGRLEVLSVLVFLTWPAGIKMESDNGPRSN